MIEIEAIREADNNWLKVIQNKNLEKLVNFYHDDATWLLPNEPVINGKDAILERWSKAYQVPGFQIEWRPFKVEISDSLEMGVSIGHWKLSMDTKSGSQAKTSGYYVVLWKKVLDKWKIQVDISN